MAEYYPLLARAVAALPNATPESRRNVYERARQALIGQLRRIDPPVAEADIERESRALDEAVARLEAEENAKAAAATSPQTAAPAPAPKPFSFRSTPAPSQPKSEIPPMPAPATEPPAQPIIAAAAPPPAAPPRPPRPTIAMPMSPLTRAADDSNMAPPASPLAAAAPVLGGVQRMVGTNPSPQLRAPEPIAAPHDFEAVLEQSVPASDFEALDRGAARRAAEAPGNSGGWRDFGRARQAEPDLGVARGEATRPPAPQPKRPGGGLSRHWIVGAVVLILVAGIAVMAFWLKDNPADLANRAKQAAPAQEASQPAGKIADRVASGTPANAAGQTATAGTAATQPAPQTSDNSPSSGVVIPVAQRAALLVEAPDDPQKVKTYVGTVIWRRENVSRGQDQPLSTAVRADIDLPEAKLKASLVFQKNNDPTLPASHTIEVRFTPADGSPISAVKQIDVPQMRQESMPAGDALAGVPAAITQNFFLVGLTQGDTAVARNVDLIKSRQWIDIPLLLADGKIAKITFEKGAPGDQAIEEALAAWQ